MRVLPTPTTTPTTEPGPFSGLFDYSPHPHQEAFHLVGQKYRFRVLVAGRRSGKSRAGAADFAATIINLAHDKMLGQGKYHGQPPQRFTTRGLKLANVKPFIDCCVVAPTYALLGPPREALAELLRTVEEGGWIEHQTSHVWWLKHGIRINFLSADTPSRLVGSSNDFIWLDEAARCDIAVAWEDSLLPSLADKQGGAIFTTTPLGKKTNKFYELLWAKGNREAAEEIAEDKGVSVDQVLDPRYASIHWTSRENTKIPGMQQELDLLEQSMDPATFAQNFEASFDSFLGQCIPFTPVNFVGHGWTHHAPLYSAGVDYGFSHKSAVSLWKYDQVLRPERIEEVDSFGQSELTPTDTDAWRNRRQGHPTTLATHLFRVLHAEVGERWRAVPVHFPLDRPDITEQFIQRGFNMVRSNQRPLEDLGFVQTFVKRGILRVMSRALKAEMTSLRYPDSGRESAKPWHEDAKTGGDDIWDAARAALTPLIQGSYQPQLNGVDTGWRRR